MELIGMPKKKTKTIILQTKIKDKTAIPVIAVF
jgi:hypothetical protein